MNKRIALFIDGTWNDPCADHPTNVCKLYERAKRNAGADQVIHYIPGIGTSRDGAVETSAWFKAARLKPESKSWLARKTRRYLGGTVGFGMASKIKEAYAFLVHHYNRNDQVFLFGFSRGAFAVRSLAGFIDEVGLLLRDHIDEVPLAYMLYESKKGKHRRDLANKLQRLTGFSRPDRENNMVLPVHMIGVWDTVGALGIHSRQRSMPIFNTGYHNTRLPTNISNARHALALHELREKFEPLLWDQHASGQSLRQVWFAGAHADVGGGYPETALSDIALAWMAHEAQELGLNVDAGAFDERRAIPGDAVHDVIQGWFAGAAPTIRHFVKTRSEEMGEEPETHALHRSAIVRLSGPGLPSYRSVWAGVNSALQEIDDRTPRLALRFIFGSQPIVEFGEDPRTTANYARQDLPEILYSDLNAIHLANLGDKLEQFQDALPSDSATLARVIAQNLVLRGNDGERALYDLVSTANSRMISPEDDQDRERAKRDASTLLHALAETSKIIPGPSQACVDSSMGLLRMRDIAAAPYTAAQLKSRSNGGKI